MTTASSNYIPIKNNDMLKQLNAIFYKTAVEDNGSICLEMKRERKGQMYARIKATGDILGYPTDEIGYDGYKYDAFINDIQNLLSANDKLIINTVTIENDEVAFNHFTIITRYDYTHMDDWEMAEKIASEMIAGKDSDDHVST